VTGGWVEVRRRVVLAGVVTEAGTGAPVADASVELASGPAAFEKLRARVPGRGATTSRADGLFHFFDLPPGKYTLAVAAGGGRFGAAKATARVGGASTEPVRVELALPPTRIEGKVVTADGSPVALAVVTVQGTRERVLTRADGTFGLRAVEPGARRLEVSARGFARTAETVTLRRPGTVERVRVVLAPA
jgi:hypothetical protein